MSAIYDADGEQVVDDKVYADLSTEEKTRQVLSHIAEPQTQAQALEMCWSDDLNTLREIVAAVIEMRTAQKAFFKERRYSDLDRSKKAERKVDELLKRHGVQL